MQTREIIYLYISVAASKLLSFLWKEFYLTFIWIIEFKQGCLCKSQYLQILGCNCTDADCRTTMPPSKYQQILTEKCWLRHVETMIKSLNHYLAFGVDGDTKSLSLYVHRQHMRYICILMKANASWTCAEYFKINAYLKWIALVLYLHHMSFNHREWLCSDQDVRDIMKASFPVHDPVLIHLNKLLHIVIKDCSCGVRCSSL